MRARVTAMTSLLTWFQPHAIPRSILISAVLLVPCFWHSRIQAGDLASHVYNAWLADLIPNGHLTGLVLVQPWTNFLFDISLSALIHLFGYGAGQRLAVAFVVLVFFWGALRLIACISPAPEWTTAPLLAIFTYGSTFHAGFFNFLLGTGLSFWAIPLLLQLRTTPVLGGLALLALAFAAHPMPVACAAAILAYIGVTRRVSPVYHGSIFVLCIVCLVLIRFAITACFVTSWFPEQLIQAAGLDQAWLFGARYFALLPALAAPILSALGRGSVTTNVAVHLWALAGLSAALLPARIEFPGFLHGLVFISDRFSLIAGVMLLAAVGRVKLYKYESASLCLATAVFFGMLYFDTGRLNRLEDRIEAALSGVPPNSRVVLGMHTLYGRSDPFAHMIDRACIGRCFSYANYEPSTRQFRVRALGPNDFVVHAYADSWAMQMGKYRVSRRDRPLFAVYADREGIKVRELHLGETIPRTSPPDWSMSGQIAKANQSSNASRERPLSKGGEL